MATAKEIKARLRKHAEERVKDVSLTQALNINFYRDVAYGALWAAYLADAISHQECDAYLIEIGFKKAPTEAAHG